MSDPGLKLAKAFAAGLKRSIRESRVPISKMQVHVTIVTDNADVVALDMNGVPPFVTTAVTVNGSTRIFNGHNEIENT